MIQIENQAQLDRLKQEQNALLVLFGGENCGVCQTIKPQIVAKYSEKFPNLKMVYIDCEVLQEVCPIRRVFTTRGASIFMGQKFIEEVRGFSLLALEQKIEQVFTKMNR
ncbi:MAG: thioredoxin family protein [Candidatus Thiodubiliella endoseptemdiera]|uniref:Thioredoxin family protein n=1 Tax=Candidatus Thiodubiliella endoseptemdiera TaxID=2738886 RepID=A0A853EYM5_9GAMM|nr:thioredoxin family protein [Candidatus Thiodubiliella endoseptemdiera]